MSDHWQTTTLGNVCELKRGYDLPSRDRRPGPFPLMSSSGPTDTHAVGKIAGPGVVAGRCGTIGQVFYVEQDFWPLNTALYVRDFKGNDRRFVYYFLKTIDWFKFNDKSGVPGVNRNDAHKESVVVPPLPEQQAIAATLGALDDKIALNRRTCATLEAMARALFRSWFVDFDPVHARAAGEAPAHMPPADAALFPDRFGEDGLPERWRMEPIGDATYIVGGSTPSTKNPEFWGDGAHLWATPRDLSRLHTPILLDTERRITDAGVAQISSRQLPPGTLLLSSRAPIGYLAIAQKPVSVNQGFIAIRETADLPSSYTLFWCRENMEAIVANANGSTIQGISKRNFRPLPVIVPPRAVMAAYRRIADPLIAKIAANEIESAALATLRDTLLPKLMSGEVRVRAAEAQVAGVA